MRLLALTIALTTLCLLPAGAQVQDLYTDDGWPRMDVLELLVTDDATLDFLVAEDIIIDREHPPGIRVYVTATQRAKLDAQRIPYFKVGQQPEAPKKIGKANLGEYHDYAAMTTRLETYAAAYPHIVRLVSLGKSIENREIWAVQITDNPGEEEDEPEFKYVSTIHGDEPMGTELCLYLIDLLVTSHGQTSEQGRRLTQLVNNTDIWIVPLMNPDGGERNTRYNKSGVDLNRNFPSFRQDPLGAGNIFDGSPLDTTGRQVETQLVMQWTAANSFVLSANIHTGALVVNYPYDEGPSSVPANTYAIAPDDELFVDISLRYSEHNPPLFASAQFPNGISNGSDWYTIFGGMQDWNYRYVSCNEVTLELSGIKAPQQGTLPAFWENNRESMLSYMESIHIGVRGLVKDACTGDPVYARVRVAGNAQPVYTDPDVGDFHRMLLPGTYSLTIDAPGYSAQTINDVTVGEFAAERVDVALAPVDAGACTPEGEIPAPLFPHDADPDGDGVIELQGLLRTVQLFSSYRYRCENDTEDGYGLGQEISLACEPHAADYAPHDYTISLSELLRVIQIFSNGGYAHCPASDEGDGFCPVSR